MQHFVLEKNKRTPFHLFVLNLIQLKKSETTIVKSVLWILSHCELSESLHIFNQYFHLNGTDQ